MECKVLFPNLLHCFGSWPWLFHWLEQFPQSTWAWKKWLLQKQFRKQASADAPLHSQAFHSKYFMEWDQLYQFCIKVMPSWILCGKYSKWALLSLCSGRPSNILFQQDLGLNLQYQSIFIFAFIGFYLFLLFSWVWWLTYCLFK